VGYGLGIEQYVLPGGVELVGHLGGAAGDRSFVGGVWPLGVTLTFAVTRRTTRRRWSSRRCGRSRRRIGRSRPTARGGALVSRWKSWTRMD
jgi:hypothetical protein